MYKLVILRGIPGSGKSTIAKKLVEKEYSHILSTDDFFIRPNGYYDWNPKLIKEAHEWNFTRFVYSPLFAQIIIDNTNTTYWEIKRYVEYIHYNNIKSEITIIEPGTWWKFNAEECAKRNSHGVPKETIEKMIARWEPSEKIVTQIKDEFGIQVSFQLWNCHE